MPKLLCPVKHMCISNFDSVLNLAHNHYSTFSQKHSASPVSKHFDFLISVIKSQSAECYMFPKSWIPTWYILKPKWVLLSLLQGQPKANCKWGEVCFWVKGFSLARGYNLLHRLETLRLCGKFLKACEPQAGVIWRHVEGLSFHILQPNIRFRKSNVKAFTS